jgi:putative DNA primase/helicase
MLSVKNNVGPKAANRAYSIVKKLAHNAAGDNIETSVIEWDDSLVTLSTNEVMQQSSDSQRGNKLQVAKDFLREALANNRRVDSNELLHLAEAAGMSEGTLRRAKDKLGVKSARKGFQGGFDWYLPRRVQ